MIYLIDAVVVLIIIFLIWFVPFYERIKLKRMFSGLVEFSNRLGFILWITGKIRAGKTILMAALSHILTLNFDFKIASKMKKIEYQLPEVPFQKIKSDYINYIAEASHDEAVRNIISLMMEIDDIDRLNVNYELDHPYFDYLKYKNKIELLKEYLGLYKEQLRNNFVYSNILMWNQIKAAYSYDWKNDFFHVKNNKTFPLEKFMIICYDEKTLQDSNDNAIKKLNEDNGSSVAMRLLGNAMEETVIYMATLQDINRLVSYEREIGSSYIHVLENYMVGNRPGLLKWINFRIGFNEFIYRLVIKTKEDKAAYIDSYNYFRKRINRLTKKQEKIIARSFLMFETSIYSKLEFVGKKITPEMEDKGNYNFTFCIPIIYCWDICDTHYFKPLFDYLIKRSIIKRSNLGRTEIDLTYIDDILTKYKDKVSLSDENTNDDNLIKSIFD